MPKVPRGQKRLYGYLLALVGILAVTGRLFGPTMQAWYRTMPHAEAASIGGGFIVGALALVSVAVLLLRNDRDA